MPYRCASRACRRRRSYAATRPRPPSPPPPSSPRHTATRSCANTTSSIRSTASRVTSATARASTGRRCACTAAAPYTDAASAASCRKTKGRRRKQRRKAGLTSVRGKPEERLNPRIHTKPHEEEEHERRTNVRAPFFVSFRGLNLFRLLTHAGLVDSDLSRAHSVPRIESHSLSHAHSRLRIARLVASRLFVRRARPLNREQRLDVLRVVGARDETLHAY